MPGTQLDKIQKSGVEVSFEFDNDDTFSLKHSKDVFLLPLWRPKWAFNFIEAEQEFELLKEDDYTASLCCNLCCDADCAKCTCCGDENEEKSGDDKEQKSPRNKMRKAALSSAKKRSAHHEDDELGCCSILLSFNIFFNLHYALHIVFRLPMFYATLSLVQANSVLFRIARSVGVAMAVLFERVPIVYNLMIFISNPIFILITGLIGLLIYWLDVVTNALFFRPLVAIGLALDTGLRNSRVVEPITPNNGFKHWTESVFMDWAHAANYLVADPEGLELNSKVRDPIISPKQLLAAYSVLPPFISQTHAAEIFAPFFIQLVILWIVFWNLYIEDADEVNDTTNVRVLASAGAFLYYLIKASDSAGKFAYCVKGHSNNIFLTIDALSNVVFPYAIIPMATQVVLNSSGLEIVLNLLALDFVTTIDEELFDESVKARNNPPYCFVFRIKDLPSRRLGISRIPNAFETVLLIDVWTKKDIVEDIEGEEVTTTYWVKDKDTSQFQAKLREGEYLNQVKSLMNMENKTEANSWNACTRFAPAPKSPPSSTRKQHVDSKLNKKGGIVHAPEKMHIAVTGIPAGIGSDDIKEAIEGHSILKNLGKCSVSYLDPPRTKEDVDSTCAFKEPRGTATVFVEKPHLVPSVMGRYNHLTSKSEEVNITHPSFNKPVHVNVFPLVAAKEGRDGKEMPRLRSLFGTVLKSATNHHALTH
mmetsp:Transcript_40138/g.78115  ORF Transcript_40138/g.78115 Transcript_40138/m.78115 type:complete len:704 (-) Transcript_40138:755-2866(-)